MRVSCRPVTITLPPPLVPRTPGIHLSGVLRAIAIETGILKVDEADALSLADVRTIEDPIAVNRICIGLAWEAWYLPYLADQGVIDHPGEMELDGIYMTHDGESVDIVRHTTRPLVKIHEVKATYKSLTRVGVAINPERIFDTEEDPGVPMAGEWLWLSQVKGYCYGRGTRFADLHVLFLNGYGPAQPVVWNYSLEFTDQELEQNWLLVTEYRDDRLAQDAQV